MRRFDGTRTEDPSAESMPADQQLQRLDANRTAAREGRNASGGRAVSPQAALRRPPHGVRTETICPHRSRPDFQRAAVSAPASARSRGQGLIPRGSSDCFDLLDGLPSFLASRARCRSHVSIVRRRPEVYRPDETLRVAADLTRSTAVECDLLDGRRSPLRSSIPDAGFDRDRLSAACSEMTAPSHAQRASRSPPGQEKARPIFECRDSL